MRLVRILLALFPALLAAARGWRGRRERERIMTKLLGSPEGRRRLASAMARPRRCGGLEYDADLAAEGGRPEGGL